MTLAELEERRAYECRLTPDRALETLDDAEDVPPRPRAPHPDHGLARCRACSRRVTRSRTHATARASASGRRRSSRGSGELGARGHLILAIHRGKSLLVTRRRSAALLDPICRAELERMEAGGRGLGAPAAAPRGRRPVGARGSPDGARADAEGAEEPPLAARALRRGRRALDRLRGAAPAHERRSPAGTRCTRSRARPATRGRRSATSSAPASARPSSRPSGSRRGGSRGAGTGTTTCVDDLVAAGRLVRVDGHLATRLTSPLATLAAPHFTGLEKWACGPIFCDRDATRGHADDIREGAPAAERDRAAGRARPAGRRRARRRAADAVALLRLRRPSGRRRPRALRAASPTSCATTSASTASRCPRRASTGRCAAGSTSRRPRDTASKSARRAGSCAGRFSPPASKA